MSTIMDMRRPNEEDKQAVTRLVLYFDSLGPGEAAIARRLIGQASVAGQLLPEWWVDVRTLADKAEGRRREAP